MTGFLPLAVFMAVAATALVVVPLLRGRGESEHRSILAIALAGIGVPLLAALLYGEWSNWSWEPAAPPQAAGQASPEIAAMVESLETRLAREGGSLEDWQMLGRSKAVLGQYAEAAEAYRQAYRVSGGQDVPTLTAYAEALAMADRGALAADAGDLFERALAIAPDDPKALWYGGLVAFERGRYADAKARWEALLARGPPEEVRRVLVESIERAEQELSGATAEARPVASDASEPIRLTVTVAPELENRLDPAVPLFIIARAPGSAGPPLAVVRRRSDELPLTLDLSDADAMIAGRGVSSQAELEIVARVALSGQPIAQNGDLFGAIDYVRGNGPAKVEINRIHPSP